jgi:hypothetical protein
MKKEKIILKNNGEDKTFFYITKSSLKSKNLKIKIINKENLEIILPKKGLLNKIFSINFLPERFIEKNRK